MKVLTFKSWINNFIDNLIEYIYCQTFAEIRHTKVLL